MELHTGTDIGEREKPSVVTLGKFDGVHRGHQKLIGELFRSPELVKTVFTFTTPPRALLDGVRKPQLLTAEEKRNKMKKLGVDLLVEFPFTEAVCRMEPEIFVERVLVKGLFAKRIVTGPDFCFGYRRRGNTKLLADLAERYGYELKVVEKETEGDRVPISSTRIREKIQEGCIGDANRLLGYSYPISGKIVERAGKFVRLEVLPEKLLPPPGRYPVRILEEENALPGERAMLEIGSQIMLYPGKNTVYNPKGVCYTVLV